MRSLRGWARCMVGLIAGLGLATIGAAPAMALTATNTFNVTANIVAACTVTATNLGFGPYSPSGATAVTNTSTINTFCTVGTPYTLSLNVGTGGGSFTTTRKMANGASLMNYNLYTSAALTTVWGDGTNSTATVGGTGTGLLTAAPSTVYGSIPVGQDLPTGNYTSTIIVTVTY
jgi:spore coat protein U-like protein